MRLTLAECQRRQHPQSEQQEPFPQNQPHRGGESRPTVFPETCWDGLDSVQLREVFQHRVPVLQSCLHHIRGWFRQTARRALEAKSHAETTQGRFEDGSCSVSCQCCSSTGQVGIAKCPNQSCAVDSILFAEGNWEVLWRDVVRVAGVPAHTHTRDAERRGLAACRKVQIGEVTRARQCLTGAVLAPRTDDTLRELQSRRPETVQRAMPSLAKCWSGQRRQFRLTAKCS